MQSIGNDIRYALRQFKKSPGFFVIAVLTIALGIGATVAVFTVVHSVLMKPLPFQNSDRLVQIYDADAHNPTHNHVQVPGADFLDWQKQQHVLQQMAISYPNSYNLSGTSGQLPEHVVALTASWNMYGLLGVKPVLGRFFNAVDDRQRANAMVVLSWGLWKRRYGSNPKILGKTILLDAKPYTVIGILPRGTNFPDSTMQLWTPFFHETPPIAMQSHGAHNFAVVARLKPDVSVAHAQAELSGIQARIHQQFPGNFVDGATHVVPLLESQIGDVKPALFMLLAATGCLLLIGCVNLANLLVARSAARRKEAAIRTALGGGRWCLVREQLVESVLLYTSGGILGLLFALLAIHWLVSIHPDIPRVEGIHLDGVALAAAIGITALCGLLAGLIPLLTLKQAQLLGPLQESTRSQSAGRGTVRMRRALVTLEVALTVVLLVGAGLLLKSYRHLRLVDLGCRTDRVLTMSISLPDAAYRTPIARTNFYSDLLQRVRVLPGVQAAALTDSLPGTGDPPDHGFFIPENAPLPADQTLVANFSSVSPSYFQTMRIPLMKGRVFQPNERSEQAQFAIVSQSFARKFFPNSDPIGKHINDDNFSAPHNFQIVGVVGDVRGALASGIEPSAYVPLYRGEQEEGGISLAVATGPDPLSLALPIQKVIAGIDSNLAVSDVLTMDQILSKSMSATTLEALLVMTFAVVSLLLAAVGLFGVLSYLVAQRRGEIGIRLALGAQRGQVLRWMLLDGLRPALVGLAAGLAVGVAVTRFVQSMLYGISPLDLATFMVVAIILLAVAAGACALPAWRASRLDPMQALRTE